MKDIEPIMGYALVIILGALTVGMGEHVAGVAIVAAGLIAGQFDLNRKGHK